MANFFDENAHIIKMLIVLSQKLKMPIKENVITFMLSVVHLF